MAPNPLQIASQFAGAFCIAIATLGEASAQEGEQRLFFDEGGDVDVSNLLARGGFIPIPIIITEPAVDNGIGVVAYFVGKPPADSDLPPSRTIVGGAVTGNGSKGAGFVRTGAIADGRILYNVAFGTGLAVLDFYPGNRNFALTYNNDITFAGVRARYRFGDSGFSAGPVVTYRQNEIALDAGDHSPRLETFAGHEIDLPSIGFTLHFDNRDNPFTPTTGLNVVSEVQLFDEALGSDADFTSASLFGAWFGSRDDWTLGVMANLEYTSDESPFFMEPDIDLRGVERNRYRGDSLLSGELELRRQFSPRWGALAFVGYGRTFGDGDADADAVSYGGGIRYRIAEKLGLDLGVDIGVGPDDEILYLQFGHAWGRRMD